LYIRVYPRCAWVVHIMPPVAATDIHLPLLLSVPIPILTLQFSLLLLFPVWITNGWDSRGWRGLGCSNPVRTYLYAEMFPHRSRLDVPAQTLRNTRSRPFLTPRLLVLRQSRYYTVLQTNTAAHLLLGDPMHGRQPASKRQDLASHDLEHGNLIVNTSAS
jgi:hypothetical protein